MITQELINYIKQQIGQGASSGEIKKNLLMNGWEDKDIEDGFKTVVRDTHKLSKMIILIISSVGALLIGVLFYFFVFNKISVGKSLELDIKFPKLTYEMGEKFSGEENYYVKYDGSPFRGIILYTYFKQGFDKKYYARAQGSFKDIDFEAGKTNFLKIALTPFKQDESLYDSTVDYFYNEGDYTYGISVYNCSDIEKILNKSCNDEIETDELLKVGPIKSEFKTIAVRSGQGDKNFGDGGQIKDCGLVNSLTDKTFINDCYIESAKQCLPAKIVVNSSVDFFGMVINSKAYNEIRGFEDGRCVEYMRLDDQYLTISKDTRQQMIDSGMANNAIDQNLAEQNKESQKMIGKYSICRYPLKEYVDKLEKSKEGSFSGSSEDAEKYQCIGTMYEIQ